MCGKENTIKLKLVRIRQGLDSVGELDYQKIYESITSKNWFGKFPDWNLIKELAYKYKIKPRLYENDIENGIIHGVTGQYKCRLCRGKGGIREEKTIDGIVNMLCADCRTCNVEGIAPTAADNYFDYFLTKDELKKDSSWIEIKSMLRGKGYDTSGLI